MSLRILQTLAFTIGTSFATVASNEEGCCFSIGYGDLMRPCCLQTTPNVTASSCATGDRIGGASGFNEGVCPSTAEEAHQILHPTVLADAKQGCCFSIGFGARMQPCCLETRPDVEQSECSVRRRIGGATGFREGGCPHTAEEGHQAMQPVVLEEESKGCCFSIGFGDLMRPCCLEATPNVGLASCSVGRRIGGATGFSQGACPSSAEEAHQAMQPVALEEESQSLQNTLHGCCFSIGFGDFMRPCCLQSSPDVELSACNVGNRMGGATGFSQNGCPHTAEEAHEAIQPAGVEESQTLQDTPPGCCFSIGFGDFMRPCCLQTSPNVQASACSVGTIDGGATGFTEGVCPTTAEEAHEVLQHTMSASLDHATTHLLQGTRQHVQSNSVLPSALVACVSFAFGSLVSVVVMRYRRQNRDNGIVFMQLDS